MVSNYLKEDYVKAAEHWYIDRLFKDLVAVKKIFKPTTNQLSCFEEDYLCLLLVWYKPDEIAAKIKWKVTSMKAQLCDGLYRYLEELTQEKIVDWRDILISLNKKGYQKTPKRRVVIIIEDANLSEVSEIIERLKQIIGDNSLNIIRAESGSLVLVLEGSSQGLSTLDRLFKNGELSTLLGKKVKDVQYITANPGEPDKSFVNLNQWFQDIFEAGWQAVTTLFSAQTVAIRGFELLGEVDPDNRAVSVSRGKLIDLRIQLAGNSVTLIVTLTPAADGETNIRLRVYPLGREIYLPPDLQLIVLDKFGDIFLEAQARSADNCIQLEFNCQPGECFSVKVALGEANITEWFRT